MFIRAKNDLERYRSLAADEVIIGCFYTDFITPHPILPPELPEGWEVKSSAILWMTRDLPIMSSRLRRLV